MTPPIKIQNWEQLSKILGEHFSQQLIQQGRDGDPDWLTDILGEHKDGIKPDNTFYIPDFHGKLEGYTLDYDQIDKTYRNALKQ